MAHGTVGFEQGVTVLALAGRDVASGTTAQEQLAGFPFTKGWGRQLQVGMGVTVGCVGAARSVFGLGIEVHKGG